MSSRKKVRGYDQQTGQPIYDENLPSPMESDPLEPLPDLDRASEISLANSLATVDPNFVPAMRDDELSAPEVIANDVAQSPAKEVRRAEPALKPTGSVFGLGFIDQLNALPKEEARKMYDSLTPVQKRIYDRSFGYDEVTAAKAEQWSDEFFKEQSERQSKENSPQAVAETDAAFARAQRAYDATRKIDYAIGRLIGEQKEGAKPRYSSYVGAYSMSPLGYIAGTETRQFQSDLASLKALLGLAAAGETKGQGTVSNYERELYSAASSIGLDAANTEDSFKATLEQIKKQNDAQLSQNESLLNKLQGNKPSSQAAGQTAPPAHQDNRPRKTLMGSTYAVNPDGTLQKVAK